jgi:PEP-CTERM motif
MPGGKRPEAFFVWQQPIPKPHGNTNVTRLANRLRSLGSLGLACLALAFAAGPLAAQPVLIALSGTPDPAGDNYTGFSAPVLNASGQVAFVANTSVAGSGLFVGTPGSLLTTVALQGNAAPAGGNYTGFNAPVLNASGQVAFQATTSVSGNGIFVGTPGSPLAMAALQGAAAPNCGGATFNGTFGNPVLNASGEVAILGTLTTGSGSPAVTTATNQGLFAGEPGDLVLCVRKGDVLAADPTSTVSAINFTTGSGGQDGKGMSFNDSGEIVYELTFADGSSGIFESQITGVPEPSTLVLTGLGGLGLIVRRRTKAK